MKKIEYFKSSGRFFIKKICGKGADAVILALPPQTEGTVEIGGESFSLTGSAVKIPRSALQEGKMCPFLCTEGITVALEPFFKYGSDVTAEPLSDEDQRVLFAEIEALKERFELLAKTVKQHSEKINETIF